MSCNPWHSSRAESEAACLEAVAGVCTDEEGRSSCEQRGSQLGLVQDPEVSHCKCAYSLNTKDTPFLCVCVYVVGWPG